MSTLLGYSAAPRALGVSKSAIDATQFPGDWSQKVNAAVAAAIDREVPQVDATGLTGAQSMSEAVHLGSAAYRGIHLALGKMSLTTNGHQLLMYTGGSVEGQTYVHTSILHSGPDPCIRAYDITDIQNHLDNVRLRGFGVTQAGVADTGCAIELRGMWHSFVEFVFAQDFEAGIRMDGTDVGIYSTTLHHNILSGNRYGIHLLRTGTAQKPNRNSIYANRIVGAQIGIYAAGTLDGGGNYNADVQGIDIGPNDIEEARAGVSYLMYLVIHNSTIRTNWVESVAAPGDVMVGNYLRGAGNTILGQIYSVVAGGGLVKQWDYLETGVDATNEWRENSTGDNPFHSMGGASGGEINQSIIGSNETNPGLRLRRNGNPLGSEIFAVSLTPQGLAIIQKIAGGPTKDDDTTLQVPTIWDANGTLCHTKNMKVGGDGFTRSLKLVSENDTQRILMFSQEGSGNVVDTQGADLIVRRNGTDWMQLTPDALRFIGPIKVGGAGVGPTGQLSVRLGDNSGAVVLTYLWGVLIGV